MRLLAGVGLALMAASACGPPAPPSRMVMVGPPASETPPSALAEPATPRANDKPPEPLTCKDWVVGISDYAAGAKGSVTNILEATRTTEAINHEANDQVQQIGATTQIVRDGEIIFVGEWHLDGAGGWLLDQYKACVPFFPPQPEE